MGDIGVVVPVGVKRKRTEDEESRESKKSRGQDLIPCDNELLSTSEDIGVVVPVGVKRKRTEDEESRERVKRKRTEDDESRESKKSRGQDLIPCDNELLSTSEDIGVVVPVGVKRKRTEDEESRESKKSRGQDLIPCDNELLSPSGDIGVVVPVGVKRKRTEDEKSRESKKSRGLDLIPCDNELPSTSEAIESTNTPEAAVSNKRSVNGKRKAVADDGPVQKKNRTLDASAMFKAKYLQQKKLGEGGFGCVYAGIRRVDNLPVAIKHIDIDEDLFFHEDSNGINIPMEVAVLLKLEANSERHSAAIGLLNWYIIEEKQKLILVMERPMPSVDLFDYIQSKGGVLKETEAKDIIRQLVNAAIELQRNNIFHRDIKVENLLIETCIESPRVRLLDFGLSCFDDGKEVHKEFCGSFAPPEWYSQEEYKAGPTTVFTIGVVMYFMLHRVTVSRFKSFRNLKSSWWISEFCRDFYKKCMDRDPDERFTLEQLKNHQWLR
ncbi:serine/threonine-protein kinase pim-1-like [Pseudoliparis swirei]|uniref:serine/threonine-protein kinase pim-1-like n=1 Tax=Pseudoliparis swirei TaxID=2059687 RepID=UPI0024BE524E|nr:serine/threonine-protein kinase pim-1-like [Pseudoliparis swirei]